MSDIQQALGNPLSGAPFDKSFQIPMVAAEQMPFFKKHYWGRTRIPMRRIRDGDRSPVTGSTPLLSSRSNSKAPQIIPNSCLLLNWKAAMFFYSRPTRRWATGSRGRTLNGKWTEQPSRAPIFFAAPSSIKLYHGSHNATLKDLGLEQMRGLELAFMPVNHEIAVKKSWGKIP